MVINFLICIIIFCVNPLNAQDDSISNMQTIGSEAFEVMRQFYEYDKSVPLEASIVDQFDGKGYVREKIVFRGKCNQVPGYLERTLTAANMQKL